MSFIAWIIVVASVLALAAILWMVRSARETAVNLEELRAQLRPLDVCSFRNLTDTSERQYLRDRLPAQICFNHLSNMKLIFDNSN